MHLGYSTSKYRGNLYKTYYIARSVRKNNTVRKDILWTLGKLTDDEAMKIKMICETMTDSNEVLTMLSDIVVKETKPYGELFIANLLWDEWKFSKIFSRFGTNSLLTTEIVTQILTINRCTSPCSHYAIPDWIKRTAISEITGHNLEKVDENKIYYELDKIASNQDYFEDHLFNMTFHKNKDSYRNINYDLSTSYFYGMKCDLSNYGVSKDGKSDHKQVMLGVMVNDLGYPFKWDVYPGNTSEIETLEGNINACCKRFKLKNVNIVFDRGIASDDNLQYIDKNGLKYITALDKDQIPNVPGINLDIFEGTTGENYEHILTKHGFKKYAADLWYYELGHVDTQRYILGFNPILKVGEQECRNEKMAVFEKFLVGKNEELRQAKRKRKQNPTRDCIISELKRLKIKKYYHEPVLEPINIMVQTKKGLTRKVSSFKVHIDKKYDIAQRSNRLDGLCVFVTNHIENKENEYNFSPEDVIRAYREKTKIEDAFKHIKSFVKIRPFFVHTESHVRAVYTICMLSYFLNKDLAERRKRIENSDFLNSKQLYEPFEKYYFSTIIDKRNAKMKREPMKFTAEDSSYIAKMGFKRTMAQM